MDFENSIQICQQLFGLSCAQTYKYKYRTIALSCDLFVFN